MEITVESYTVSRVSWIRVVDRVRIRVSVRVRISCCSGVSIVADRPMLLSPTPYLLYGLFRRPFTWDFVFEKFRQVPVSYTHLTLPTNREV